MVSVFRRRWVVAGAVAAVAIALALFAFAANTLRSESLTARVSASLADALNCDVTMDRLEVQLWPRIRVSGARLEIRLRNRSDLPPFVAVDKFRVNLGLLSLVRHHIEEVHLDGLHVNVPPRVMATIAAATAEPAAAPAAGAQATTAPAPAPGLPLPKPSLFRVDHIITHNALLNFVAKKAGGRPLAFDIQNLELLDAGVNEPMRFISALTNPVPEGRVYSRGEFGPWNRDDPALTPLKGAYSLADADLSTINGIAGLTSSMGTFSGILTEITVEGTSDTPAFSLDLGGRPVPLSTTFQVTVDGTDGTTKLDAVNAKLVDTNILVTGTLSNLPGPKNHDVDLMAEVRDGHVEDLMQLAIDTPKPVVTGSISLVASLKLPPGPGRAQQRLDAHGTVKLRDARFTDPEMIAKVADLSRRGQGKKPEDLQPNVPADFNGEFKLSKGIVRLTKTEVQVPGAVIQVAGTYSLGSEEVDFIGEALLETSLSRAIGGFKSIFLKPFDPLFRKKGAGAVVPIRITGTRPAPKFGVRKAAVFGKGH